MELIIGIAIGAFFGVWGTVAWLGEQREPTTTEADLHFRTRQQDAALGPNARRFGPLGSGYSGHDGQHTPNGTPRSG